ncbi:phosphotransferase enzyme family protein [Trinickia soli]|jgi:Ser/Thr protein kinase RdoA (MazF antagonist)|uniref:phosphotransferase enzyme family protein n=1 Tax=Trinickia soli TaxID=380675 RepID=UPI003FA3B5FE
MDQPLRAPFDAICEAYALKQSGPARRISERVWHLPTASGDVAVKLYTAGQHTRANKEATVLTHLAAHGDARFRVQTLQRTADGAPAWTGCDAQAMLTRWEAGQFRTYDTFAPAEWRALGASLAALHLSLDRLTLRALDTIRARLITIDADDTRRDLLDAIGHTPRDGDGALLRVFVDVCLRMLDTHYPGSIDAFPAGDPQHPIHNDYNQFNYLFDGTLPPIILDWEAAIGAPREFEVIRCLNHLPLEAPDLAAAFVQAYLQVRPLHADRIAWAVDAACLQHALKRWVVQGWLNDAPRFAAHLHGAMKMASTLLGARGRLIDFFSRCLDAGSP